MTTTDASAAIAELADRLLALSFEAEPLEATLTGVREYDALLADISVDAEADRAVRRAEIRAAAQSVDPDVLTYQERLTRAVIIAQTEYADDMDAARQLDYTVAMFPVSPSSFLLAYVRMIVLTSPAEAEDYLARLGQIPRYLAQAEVRLAAGRADGLTPVAHLVQMAIDQIDKYLATEPDAMAVPAPAGWDGAEEWAARRDAVLSRVVHPAFASHRDALAADVLPTGRSNDAVGLVHLPDGLAKYAHLVRVHTTTDRTPEELHAIGLEVMAGIHQEFRALGEELFGLTELSEIFAHLTTDPSLRWSSRQEILDAAEVAVRRAEAVAPQWFGNLPEAVCALEAIPELEAEGAPAAYYMQPALDGSRPGTYYTNVENPTERTTFDLESVAYHEAVPGHHFQISLSLETPGLPMLRKLSFFTAYVEGWGLYSERLADEMGLYSSSLQRMGMLSADAWRAGRLVVDTGMHAFGWSRQQAVDYLLTNTPVAPIEVEAEIDRYIALPAQALAYMTGRLEIQAARARAAATLGDRFDVTAFHDVILGSGALPLAIMGDVVDEWAESMS